MKKKNLLLTTLTLSAAMLLSVFPLQNKTVNAENSVVTQLNTLISTFYNNGHYVKDTNIYLNDNAIDDLAFHNQSKVLDRTTYYTPDALWMSRNEGKTSYSYYGTDSEGNLTSGSATTPLVAPEKPTLVVKKGLNKEPNHIWDDEDVGMEGYYITLKDIIANEQHGWTWNKDENIYRSSSDELKFWFKLFCAPCYVGTESGTGNYIDFSGVEIEQKNEKLELRLMAHGTNDGAIKNSDGNSETSEVFAKATVHYFTFENAVLENVEENPIFKLTGKAYGLDASSFRLDLEKLNDWSRNELTLKSVEIENNSYTITTNIKGKITPGSEYISHLFVKGKQFDIRNIDGFVESIQDIKIADPYYNRYSLQPSDPFNNGYIFPTFRSDDHLAYIDGKEILFNSERILTFKNKTEGSKATLTLYVTKLENVDIGDEKGKGFYLYTDSDGKKSTHNFQLSMFYHNGWQHYFESKDVNGGTLVETFNTDNAEGYTATINDIEFYTDKLSWHKAILNWDN